LMRYSINWFVPGQKMARGQVVCTVRSKTFRR